MVQPASKPFGFAGIMQLSQLIEYPSSLRLSQSDKMAKKTTKNYIDFSMECNIKSNCHFFF